MNDIISCSWDDIRDFFEEGQTKISEYEIIEDKHKKHKKKNENKILRKVVER